MLVICAMCTIIILCMAMRTSITWVAAGVVNGVAVGVGLTDGVWVTVGGKVLVASGVNVGVAVGGSAVVVAVLVAVAVEGNAVAVGLTGGVWVTVGGKVLVAKGVAVGVAVGGGIGVWVAVGAGVPPKSVITTSSTKRSVRALLLVATKRNRNPAVRYAAGMV